MKKTPLRREAAQAMLRPKGGQGHVALGGTKKFLLQAARRITRLQERRRKLRRDLRVLEEELSMARRQMRDALGMLDNELDTPLPDER